MDVLTALIIRYRGGPLVPVDTVAADWFNMTTPKLVEAITAGRINLPITRMGDGRKAAKFIHLTDLAAYIEAQDTWALFERYGLPAIPVRQAVEHHFPDMSEETFVAESGKRKSRVTVFSMSEGVEPHRFVSLGDLSSLISNGGFKCFVREPIPYETRRAVYKRDGKRCAYCGDSTKGPFEIDHIHPVVKGGDNSLGNLTVACRSCNASKREKTLDEWRGPKCQQYAH